MSYVPPGRTITAYAWNFGTQGTPATGSGVMPSCTFGTADVHNVTLTVTDDLSNTATDTLAVTVFKGTLTLDTNRLLFPLEPASGANGASGNSVGKSTQDEPRSTTKTTTPTVDTPTVTLSHEVQPARTFFAPSRVRFRVEGTVNGRTYTKQYNLPGQPPETNVFEVEWDGTDNLGNRVPDGHYTAGASVYSKNSEEAQYKHDSSTQTITLATDTLPIALITVVTEAVDFGIGETIQFNASACYDPDDFVGLAPYSPDDFDVNAPNNGITHYEWDFGEGATPQTLSGPTASTASCTYSSAGEKTVTLTVLDNDGEQGQQVDPAQNPKAVLASAGVHIGGAVAILSADPNDARERTTNVAIIDSEYYSQIADPQIINTLANKTRKAKIVYETNEQRFGAFPRREITLEIGNDADPNNDPTLTYSLTPHTLGVRSTEWDGRFVAAPPEQRPDPPYGLFYAHIRLKISTDDDPDWEHNYVSEAHAITVDTWPIADAGGDQSVYVGDTVTFDGSGSRDPDGGDLRSYTWNFNADDQLTTPITVTDNTRNHAYGKADSYTVTLTVTDDEGRISPRKSTMTVAVSEIGVSISNADDSSVAIDTEYNHNVVGSVDRSSSANINYEITAGSGDAISELRLTLEIGNDTEASTKPTTSITKIERANANGEIARTGSFVWNGKRLATPLYGTQHAQIKLEVKLKNKTEWETMASRSDFHAINVGSLPVANAGEDRVVAIDTTKDLVIVPFDASNSTDPDDSAFAAATGGVTGWKWSFTGTDLTQDPGSDSATTETVDTPYRSAGTKMVTLTLSDKDTPALDDEDTAEITVIDVEIDDPTNNENVVLTTDTMIPMEVQGRFLPTIAGPHELNWEITVGGTTYTTITNDGQKGKIAINATGFPSNNNDFGPNNMKLTVTYKNITVAREQSVKVFFKRDGFENGASRTIIEPTGQVTFSVPNWYVFWKQTPANLGTHLYDARSTAYGYYSYGDKHFHLATAIQTIDDFGRTCIHEQQHMDDYQNWWVIPHGGYSIAHDSDGDYVPDALEGTLGFNLMVGNWDSNGDNRPDAEEPADAAEHKWNRQANVPGSGTDRARAYEQDWSKDGKQW